MESEDTRTLKIEIPGCSVTSSDGLNWDGLAGLNGWDQLVSTPLVLFWEGTIDLSGYVRHMKTFYPMAGLIQEGGPYVSFGGSGNRITTIVSSIPLDPENLALQLAGNGGPGFLDLNLIPSGIAQQNYETVMFAESKINLINAQLPAIGVCQPIINNQYGSLSPTANDTLYVVRMLEPFIVANLVGNSMSAPPSRVVLPGKFGTEPDVEYMMRLKRSVELANQV